MVLAGRLEKARRLLRDGDLVGAAEEGRRLSGLLREESDPGGAAVALSVAARALCVLDACDDAAALGMEAQELASASQRNDAVASAMAARALAQLRVGRRDRAAALCDGALDAANDAGDCEEAAVALLVAAESFLAGDEPDDARACAERALGLGERLGLPHLVARARLVLAVGEDRRDDARSAQDLLGRAREDLVRAPEAETTWLVEGALAACAETLGRRREAALHRQAAAEAVERVAVRLDARDRTRLLESPGVAGVLRSVGAAGAVHRMPLLAGVEAEPLPDAEAMRSMRPLLDVIKKINGQLDPSALLAVILDKMLHVCRADRGVIVAFHDEGFDVQIARDRVRGHLRPGDVEASREVLRSVQQTREPLVVVDTRSSERLATAGAGGERAARSVLCVPLQVKTRLLGAVYLEHRHGPDAFGAREVELADILTEHAALAIDNAVLHHRACHDPLTELANHTHFEASLAGALARARRHRRSCGLIMLDVDAFKLVNDTHGHLVGNDVLQAVARRIAATVRAGDVVARSGPLLPPHVSAPGTGPLVGRYGGDEFEVLLPDASRSGVERVAARILEEMRRRPVGPPGHYLRVGVSIGAAVYPDDATDARELVRKADDALYAAKRAGKGRFVMSRAPHAAAAGRPRP